MATYYFRSTGTNWGNAGDWSATPSPSYTAGAVPTAADDAVFEAASANCIINAGATRNCVNLTCTSYTGTLTFNTNLAVTGNVSLGSASMTMAGTSTLALTPGTTLTLTSAGCICAVPMSITRSTGTATLTWGSNWTQSGAFTISGTTIWTWNGNTVTFKGTSIAWNNVSTFGGTTAIVIAPDLATTMNITTTTGVRWGFPSVTINGAGTINLNLSTLTLSTNIVFTYTAGTVNHTGTLLLATATMNTAGMVFQNGQTNNTTNTTTLTSDLTFTGNFIIPSSIANINPAGRNLNIGGNFTNNNAGGSPTGNANIVINGTGTISGSSVAALSNPLIINTSGTATFSGTILWLRTLTFTAGTIVSTGSTIQCSSSSTFTLNAPGFNFGTLIGTSITLAGTEGCTFGTFTSQTAGAICTFQSTETYTITTALNLLGTAASALAFKSSSAGSQATVNLNYGASLDVGHVTATDINSSGGRTIWDYKGTLSNATNWQQLPTVPKTVGETWVR